MRATGIDPSVLPELPADMRREIIVQSLPQIRRSEAFLDALSPEVRAEVEAVIAESQAPPSAPGADAPASAGQHPTQQEQQQQQQQDQAGADMDTASFLATLPQGLRDEIYLTSDEAFINSLPAHLAAEARYARERERAGSFIAGGGGVGGDGLPTSASAAWSARPSLAAAERRERRPRDGIKFFTRLDDFRQALCSPHVPLSLLTNTALLLCWNVETRLALAGTALRLLHAASDTAVSRSAEVLSGMFRFSPVIAHDLLRTRQANPLVAVLDAICERARGRAATTGDKSRPLEGGQGKQAAERSGRDDGEVGAARATALDALISLAYLYVHVIRGERVARVAPLAPAPSGTDTGAAANAADAGADQRRRALPGDDESAGEGAAVGVAASTASAVPTFHVSAMYELSQVYGVRGLSYKSYDRLVSLYEYLAEKEENRGAVIACLADSARGCADKVCRTLARDEQPSNAEAQLARMVRSLVNLARSDLSPLSGLQAVWSALDARMRREPVDSLRCLTMIECFLMVHAPRVPKVGAPDEPEEQQVQTSSSSSAPTTPHRGAASSATTTSSALPHTPSTASAVAASTTTETDSPMHELATFLERHQVAINKLLQLNPLLLSLSSSFRATLLFPRFLEFESKKAFFRSIVQEHRRARRAPPVRLLVRRDSVFEDSYHQLRPRTADELKGRLNVQFVGEEGIDAGGLTREWYVILARKIFDENYALFRKSAAKSGAFQINATSFINEDHLGFFKFIGRFIGKALWDGQLLDAYFVRSVYKHMIGVRPSYHDVETIDPEYYSSLCWMLENNITDVLDVNMSAEVEEFGQVKTIDLVPGGRHIAVTEQNKHEYVRLVTDLKMTKAIEQQLEALLQGFHEVVPRALVSIFSDYELEMMISGLPEVDVSDLKMHTQYNGYRLSSPQIEWFWTLMNELDRDDRARLVMFVTGSSKVPLGGFANLPGMGGGVQRFQIHRVAGDSERLPSAHTCFNQLDLPEYATRDKLRERLLTAIREGSEGFGFG